MTAYHSVQSVSNHAMLEKIKAATTVKVTEDSLTGSIHAQTAALEANTAAKTKNAMVPVGGAAAEALQRIKDEQIEIHKTAKEKIDEYDYGKMQINEKLETTQTKLAENLKKKNEAETESNNRKKELEDVNNRLQPVLTSLHNEQKRRMGEALQQKISRDADAQRKFGGKGKEYNAVIKQSTDEYQAAVEQIQMEELARTESIKKQIDDAEAKVLSNEMKKAELTEERIKILKERDDLRKTSTDQFKTAQKDLFDFNYINASSDLARQQMARKKFSESYKNYSIVGTDDERKDALQKAKESFEQMSSSNTDHPAFAMGKQTMGTAIEGGTVQARALATRTWDTEQKQFQADVRNEFKLLRELFEKEVGYTKTTADNAKAYANVSN